MIMPFVSLDQNKKMADTPKVDRLDDDIKVVSKPFDNVSIESDAQTSDFSGPVPQQVQEIPSSTAPVESSVVEQPEIAKQKSETTSTSLYPTLESPVPETTEISVAPKVTINEPIETVKSEQEAVQVQSAPNVPITEQSQFEPSIEEQIASKAPVESPAPVEKAFIQPEVQETLVANQIEQNIPNAPSNDNIDYYTKLAIEKDASDIHLTIGYPIFFRIDGRLEKISSDNLVPEKLKELVYQMLKDDQKRKLEQNEDLDFMYIDPDGNRFRVNIFHEKSNLAVAMRMIPKKVKTIDELGLPQILKDLSKIPYGLVVITGPTGSGKSTTIAAMIEEINRSEPKHIITIEDPVEYIFEKKVSLVAQRNMHEDTKDWKSALRSILRQDPNIVLIGEMRDYETIASALTIAETGHLVFATLHTNNAAQTVDRIIDVFPDGQQNQVRAQLSNMLSAVISQRLVPVNNGGRKAAMEIMIATTAIKNAIREGKTHQINNIIQTSSDLGMQTIEKALVDMIRQGWIDIQTAKNFTIRPDEIDLLLRN